MTLFDMLYFKPFLNLLYPLFFNILYYGMLNKGHSITIFFTVNLFTSYIYFTFFEPFLHFFVSILGPGFTFYGPPCYDQRQHATLFFCHLKLVSGFIHTC